MTRILHTIILAAVCLLATSCSDDATDDIYTTVTLTAMTPGGDVVTILRPDNSLAGTFIRNLNTQRTYPWPVFVNNQASITLQKGVYMLSLDGEAVMADGSVSHVRCATYSVPRDAVNLIGSEEHLTINLTVMP